MCSADEHGPQGARCQIPVSAESSDPSPLGAPYLPGTDSPDSPEFPHTSSERSVRVSTPPILPTSSQHQQSLHSGTRSDIHDALVRGAGPSGGASPASPYSDEEGRDREKDGKDRQEPAGRVDIEPARPDDMIEEDEFALTDGYETRTSGSTSATSTVYAATFENGRRYQHFKHGRYPIPNDDDELSREDMKHAMLLELMDGELYYAPIGDSPQNILDIGTGTGIWAIDMGDRFPGARVRGIDISPVQPLWVPPNVDFLVDDCEGDDWLARDVDFVHLRFMTIILKNVPAMLRRAYESLKPGGWIELQELCAEILCDDDTMPPDDPVKYMYDLAHQAFAKFGMNVTLPKHLDPLLREAGFDNIQCVVKKVPLGVWARDRTLRLIGLYQKEAVRELMPAIAQRPFAALGMSPTEANLTVALARKGMDNANVHRYFHYYFWMAQKPHSAKDSTRVP